MSQVQKAVLLQTVRTVRRFLKLNPRREPTLLLLGNAGSHLKAQNVSK